MNSRQYLWSGIFLLVILSQVSCDTDEGRAENDLTGSWKVVSFEVDGEVITKSESITWSDFNQGDITISFSEPDAQGVGKIDGIRVTNSIHGTYTLTGPGEISFGPLATTFITEPEWTRYFDLHASRNFEVRGAYLMLQLNNGNSIRLKRM